MSGTALAEKEFAEYDAQPLRGVVIYENAAARDRALSVFERVSRSLGDQLETEFSWWPYDTLGDKEVASSAAQAAANAEIVLIVAQDSQGVPEVLRGWMDQWKDSRMIEGGLLGAMAGNNNAQEFCDYLEQISRRARMDYLAERLMPEMADQPRDCR